VFTELIYGAKTNIEDICGPLVFEVSPSYIEHRLTSVNITLSKTTNPLIVKAALEGVDN